MCRDVGEYSSAPELIVEAAEQTLRSHAPGTQPTPLHRCCKRTTLRELETTKWDPVTTAYVIASTELSFT